jgi:hypothetical protein
MAEQVCEVHRGRTVSNNFRKDTACKRRKRAVKVVRKEPLAPARSLYLDRLVVLQRSFWAVLVVEQLLQRERTTTAFCQTRFSRKSPISVVSFPCVSTDADSSVGLEADFLPGLFRARRGSKTAVEQIFLHWARNEHAIISCVTSFLLQTSAQSKPGLKPGKPGGAQTCWPSEWRGNCR